MPLFTGFYTYPKIPNWCRISSSNSRGWEKIKCQSLWRNQDLQMIVLREFPKQFWGDPYKPTVSTNLDGSSRFFEGSGHFSVVMVRDHQNECHRFYENQTWCKCMVVSRILTLKSMPFWGGNDPWKIEVDFLCLITSWGLSKPCNW